MMAKGGQKHRADALPWGRYARCANSAAVSHDRALPRDALRLSLRCREDRPNVAVSQGDEMRVSALRSELTMPRRVARTTPGARTILLRFVRLRAELHANLGAHPT
jgi:hypothetical protein